MMQPGDTIAETIRGASSRGRPALIAFMTAGFPGRARFAADLLKIGEAADVIEIGVPFSDPMADGMTIQRSSRAALAGGVTLDWILAELTTLANRPRAPLLLMRAISIRCSPKAPRNCPRKLGPLESRASSSRTCPSRNARSSVRRSQAKASRSCRWSRL